MQKHPIALAVCALIATASSAFAGKGIIKVILPSGSSSSASLWPTDGDLDYADSVSLAVGDLDGDGALDLAAVADSNGNTDITGRTADGAITGFIDPAGVKTQAVIGQFGDTYTASDGTLRKSGSIVICDREGAEVQSFSWGTSQTSTYDPKHGASAGRSVAPFGTSYTGGIRVAVGDLDGDGRDELISAAQSPTPPSGGATYSQIDVRTCPSDGSGWAPVTHFNVDPSGNVGPISIACGHFFSQTKSSILTSYFDPSTGNPTLKLFSITAEVQPVGVTVDSGKFLESHNIVHRDLAARIAVGDVNRDGIDDIVYCTNDGTQPTVDVFTLGMVNNIPTITSDTPIDVSSFASTLGPDWANTSFDPTFLPSAVVASVLPDVAPQFSGTLYLTATTVPEPTSLGAIVFAAGALWTRRRRRATLTGLSG